MKKILASLIAVLMMLTLAMGSASAVSATVSVGTGSALPATYGVSRTVGVKGALEPTRKTPVAKKTDPKLIQPFVGKWKITLLRENKLFRFGVNTDLLTVYLYANGRGVTYLAGRVVQKYDYRVTKDKYYVTNEEGTEVSVYAFSDDYNTMFLYDGDEVVASYERMA